MDSIVDFPFLAIKGKSSRKFYYSRKWKKRLTLGDASFDLDPQADRPPVNAVRENAYLGGVDGRHEFMADHSFRVRVAADYLQLWILFVGIFFFVRKLIKAFARSIVSRMNSRPCI